VPSGAKLRNLQNLFGEEEFLIGVILSGAVFQAERRILRASFPIDLGRIVFSAELRPARTGEGARRHVGIARQRTFTPHATV
jgi:hypothetical protein